MLNFYNDGVKYLKNDWTTDEISDVPAPWFRNMSITRNNKNVNKYIG